MELNEEERKALEVFLSSLRQRSELKRWTLESEPVLSLPGLEIYPDRRKVYHGQQEIELNIKEFSLLYLLAANKGRVLTYGQMYRGFFKLCVNLLSGVE